MPENVNKILKKNLAEEHYARLMALPNAKLHNFVADAIELCRPASVYVCTDAPEDIAYIRRCAIERGEEIPLASEGHTIHFDGFNDQARDTKNTRYMVPKGESLGNLESTEREEGVAEVRGLLKGAMEGKEMYVRIFCLGPLKSVFSMSAVQVTDSAYVAHSEDLLYRPGYEQFKLIGDSPDFFRVLHSAGRLDDRNVSAETDKRRMYIDYTRDLVYSVNTQYAGNTVGFKKLCLRLTIRKAMREGWLSEHMFIMGVHGPKERVTYFTGAFPSACGKTSTAMVEGETIIGDDIALIKRINGEVRTVNVECGIFGIIQDVNAKDDPLIFKALNTPGEVIFSNILAKDGKTYWSGDGREHPADGENFSGAWFSGKKNAQGKDIPPSHKNARFTLKLSALPNLDPLADDPKGVRVGGMIFGGRDSDTCVPVQQAFNWAHGVVTMAAGQESETTAATLGKEGVRAFQPMANLDFLSVPVGEYLHNYLLFPLGLIERPAIFGVNYFLVKDKTAPQKDYLNGRHDKRIWLKWMELRVNGEVNALEAPTGLIPCHEDLKALFKRELNKDYTIEDYNTQFTTRIPENLAKIERILKIYESDPTTPKVFYDIMDEQRQRLLAAQARHGDYIKPEVFRK